MKLYLTIICLLLNQISFAQEGYLKIDTIKSGADYTFPIIEAANKRVQEKINIHLQLSELEYIAALGDEHIFRRIQAEGDGLYGGNRSINLRVLANNSRCLGIYFFVASCGMTCHYWSRYYNFNPKNGDRYSLQDMFTDTSFQKAKILIAALRKAKLKTEVEKVKKAGAEVTSMEEYIYHEIDDDGLEDFYFDSDSVYFDNDNLLNKGDKFYDIDQVTGIPISMLEPLLTNYGNAVLITGNDLGNRVSATEPQLYEGIIGSSPCYFLCRATYGNNCQAMYAYKKYRTGIYMEGETNETSYSFTENDVEGNEFATFTLKKLKNRLLGNWQQKGTDKKVQVTLQRM